MNLKAFLINWRDKLGAALVLSGIWLSIWLWIDTPLWAKLAQVGQSLQYQAFAAQVIDGQKGVVKGVYVQGVLALPIITQPTNEPNFVSEQPHIATRYHYADAFGSVGLIAHNHLAGASFFDIDTGQIVELVYGDGLVRRYLVQKIHYYQAINPERDKTDFIDLSTRQYASASDVFVAMYGKKGRLVLQTCIAQPGQASWGRLFLVAVPLDY